MAGMKVLVYLGPGDVPTCQPGRILGHEGIGIVEKAGDRRDGVQAGD